MKGSNAGYLPKSFYFTWLIKFKSPIAHSHVFKKVDWIRSHDLQWKFKLLARKFTWGNKAKRCWVMLTFPPIIWIFTEGTGDGIKSRIPFKIFSTLRETNLNFQVQFQILELHFFVFFAISWCGCRNGCPCLSFWHCLRKFRVDIWLRFCGLANFNFWNSVV